MQDTERSLPKINDVSEAAFDVAELRSLKPIPMLYQAGYLTIKSYDPLKGQYALGVPDEEVRRDLCTLMTGVAADTDVQLQTAHP